MLCVYCVYQWICTIFRMNWLTVCECVGDFICANFFYLFKSQRVDLYYVRLDDTFFFYLTESLLLRIVFFLNIYFFCYLTFCVWAKIDQNDFLTPSPIHCHPLLLSTHAYTLSNLLTNILYYLYIGKEDITQKKLFFIDCAVCCLLNEWGRKWFCMCFFASMILQEFFFPHLLLLFISILYVQCGNFNNSERLFLWNANKMLSLFQVFFSLNYFWMLSSSPFPSIFSFTLNSLFTWNTKTMI